MNPEWSKLFKIPPEDLSEQDKEDVYYDLLNLDVSSTFSNEHLCSLFKLSQEVLRFKGEQVESLVSEIDNLAARQGEEEAQRHKVLLDEIESLQGQLIKANKFENFTGSSLDEIRQELVKIELKNEELISELQSRERDLLNEKKEVEKFANQVMVLERERGELRSELAALQRESLQQHEARLQSESPKSSIRHKELVETIRHKNNHITQLLADIEAIEKENNLLKLKVAGLHSDNAEKNEQINLLTGENTNYKLTVAELQERIIIIEEQNEALKNQMIEMAADKQRRDEKLDQLGIALDARLSQWQELLVQKDTELIELRQKLSQITAQFPNSYVSSTRNHLANMTQSLENREEQIEELQQQLAESKAKLSESQEVINQLNEQLKSKSEKHEESPRLKKMKRELAEAHSRLKLLEAKVVDAENDAEAKAEEMTEMVIQLREYETGVFGLPEAMQQIKELQKQKKVRDGHIEQLIQAGNQLQSDANLLEEENLALRAQLGLDVDAVVRVDGVLAKHKADQAALSDITHKLEATNNSLLTLKVQNRMYKKMISRLKNQLKNIGYEPEVISSEDDSSRVQPVVQGLSEEIKALLVKEAEVLEKKLQDVIDENEALRKGMHEILDSVRSHDGTSAVHIESACLERLLEALDSRHLSGWYHPAMRLQAQLNMVEGNNAALREQIRISRFGEHEATVKLHKALIQIDLLQSEVQRLVTASLSVEKEGKKEDQKFQVSARAIEFVEALKSKKDKITQEEQDQEKPDSSKLEQQLQNISKKLSETEVLMAEQKEVHESDKESWLNVRKGLQNDIDSLNEKVTTLSAEVKEYSENLIAIQSNPDVVKSSLANATIRLGTLSSDNEKLKRKCSILQDIELQLKNELGHFQEELGSTKSSMKQKLQTLKAEKDKTDSDYNVLKKIHSECFPTSELVEKKQQLNELTIKYRELLVNKTNLDEANNRVINGLRAQVNIFQKNFDKLSLTASSNNQLQDRQLVKQSEEIEKDMKEHAEKMYKLVKDQLKESEDHCKDLEKQLASMVQQNLSLQLTEAELRDQLVDSISHSQFQEIKKQLLESEKLAAETKAEYNKLEVDLDVEKDKVKALEQLHHCHDYQHDALQRQVLELSASSEDKLTIGRLTRELLRAQDSELAASKENADLKNTIDRLEKVCEEQENNIKNLNDQFLSEKTEMRIKYRWLVRTVNELHQRYLGHLSLLSAESMQALLSQALFEKTSVLAWVAESVSSDKIIEIVKNQLNEAEGITAQKLQELKLKVNIQAMESQVSQIQGQLQRVEQLCSILQDELINQEKLWEKKQIIWEQNLLKDTLDLPTDQEKVQETDVDSGKQITSSDEIPASNDVKINIDTNKISKSKEEKETMTSNIYNYSPESPLALESENIKLLNNQLNQVTLMMNEQTLKLNHCGTEISDLKSKLDLLKKQLEEKEVKLSLKEKELIDLQTSLVEKHQDRIEEESTEVLALKATVASLQNIVNQKEETIGRYQTLLHECREEHSKAVTSLQQELSSLQQTLSKKTATAASKEISKEDVEKSSSAMRVILERYLARVHQLEDDLAKSRDQTVRLTAELGSSQQQTEKWTHTAEERLKTIQEMKQRLDSARSKEDLTDSNSELMEKSTEIMELNKIICNLKAKLETKETVSASRERVRGELDRTQKRLEMIQNQNTELKAEVQRLRKQLTLRQSSTPKSEVVSTAREESLQKKIKSLEEKISEYQNVIQRGKEIHKSKCDEEFGKWEERKKWQANTDKLKTLLKEKSCQVEALRVNVDRLKETIIRLEKEKITLEGKLKSVKVPSISQSLVDELEKDRAKLQQELLAVRMKSSEGSSLTNVIESQERRIATLKVAQKGEAALAEEVERLLEAKSRLQQTNLRLEAKNLELKMQLEKSRLSDLTPRDQQDTNSETESVGYSPKGKTKMGKNRADLERAVVVMKRVVDKLQAENKKLHSARLSDVHDKGYVEKLQIELQNCQENYLDAVDKCSALEEELKHYKEKLSLYKQDDLVEELALTKSQLAQKCQLLSKVKVLLENAVIREKALKEQVFDLEKLVPPERLRGTYHERKS